MSRPDLVAPLVVRTPLHRLAGRLPRRLALRSPHTVRRLHGPDQEIVRVAAQDRSVSAALRRKHGRNEALLRLMDAPADYAAGGFKCVGELSNNWEVGTR